MPMSRFLLVSLGGAIGSGARYLVSNWTQTALGASFPFGTLLVNIVGSFLICVVMHLALSANLIGPDLRVFLTTGILGGFTTYSAFGYETHQLTQRGSYAFAALYVGATLLLCSAAAVAGDAVARLLAGS
jgi:CrcB protein